MTDVFGEPGNALVGADRFDLNGSDIPRLRRTVDILLALAVMPIAFGFGVAIWVLNHRFNPGPLFFAQIRMGAHGHSFRMWKFRTMLPAQGVRGPDDCVELDRITTLGRLMRKTRLDEVPNFYNVLIGDMSFIGPRPDVWDHAVAHCQTVPFYAERIRVAPGITGLAQVLNGYADCENAVRRKARLDAFYINHRSLWLDLYIVRSTFRIVLTGDGAK